MGNVNIQWLLVTNKKYQREKRKKKKRIYLVWLSLLKKKMKFSNFLAMSWKVPPQIMPVA